MDIPNIQVDDSELDVSDAQWSLGLPTLIFQGTYRGSAIGRRYHWEALDSDGNVVASGDIFGAINPNMPTRLSIQFTPDIAPQVSTVKLVPVAYA